MSNITDSFFSTYRTLSYTIGCLRDPIPCAKEGAKTAAISLGNRSINILSNGFYALSNLPVRLLAGLATLSSTTNFCPLKKQVFHQCLIDEAPTATKVDAAFADLAAKFRLDFNKLEKTLTKYVAPKAFEAHQKNMDYYQNKVFETVGLSPPERFSAFDLIAPTILLGICMHKSVENMTIASKYLKLLLKAENEITTSHKKGNKVYTATKINTHWELIQDIGINVLFSALWTGTAYLTSKGIQNALQAAGNDLEASVRIANALWLTASTAPSIFRNLHKIFGAIATQINSYSTPSSTPFHYDWTAAKGWHMRASGESLPISVMPSLLSARTASAAA